MNTEEIRTLAELSRLTLSDEEVSSYQKDFEKIITYIDSIKEVTLPENLQESHVTKNVMREDANPFEPGMFTKELLKAAPETEGHAIKVNKVL